jgi:hypothetical protein
MVLSALAAELASQFFLSDPVINHPYPHRPDPVRWERSRASECLGIRTDTAIGTARINLPKLPARYRLLNVNFGLTEKN